MDNDSSSIDIGGPNGIRLTGKNEAKLQEKKKERGEKSISIKKGKKDL